MTCVTPVFQFRIIHHWFNSVEDTKPPLITIGSVTPPFGFVSTCTTVEGNPPGHFPCHTASAGSPRTAVATRHLLVGSCPLGFALVAVRGPTQSSRALACGCAARRMPTPFFPSLVSTVFIVGSTRVILPLGNASMSPSSSSDHSTRSSTWSRLSHMSETGCLSWRHLSLKRASSPFFVGRTPRAGNVDVGYTTGSARSMYLSRASGGLSEEVVFPIGDHLLLIGRFTGRFLYFAG